MQNKLHVCRWNRSHERGHVRRSTPLHPTIPPNQNKTLVVSSMTMIAHNSLCSTRAYHLHIDLTLIPLMGNVASRTLTHAQTGAAGTLNPRWCGGQRLPAPLGWERWYVTNVSIIFYCSMLLYYQSWMFYIHFLQLYIIFGTNLLT